MVRKIIPVFKPFMGKEEIEAVAEVLNSGWIGMGPKTEQFEKDFQSYTGAPYAISTNSCTAALHLAIRAAGIKEGDEIITSPMTFASTVEAILYNGGVPVFADIEYGTMNINPIDIEKRITSKTKAIVPVHFGGHPCNMAAINKIAADHGLAVVEDAAHACGASYADGTKVGNGKNLTCFSFHAVKNLALGDGGMITCTDDTINARLKKMRWMGISKDTYARDKSGKYKWDYDIVEQGWKYHPNDIMCAIGIEQLKKLDKMNTRRRKIAELYTKELSKEPFPAEIELPEDRSGKPGYEKMIHARHNYVIKLKTLDREGLIAYMAEQGITLGVHYKPLYHHPRYKPYDKKDTPVCEEIWKKIVTLPVFPDMTDLEALFIINKIKEYLSLNLNSLNSLNKP